MPRMPSPRSRRHHRRRPLSPSPLPCRPCWWISLRTNKGTIISTISPLRSTRSCSWKQRALAPTHTHTFPVRQPEGTIACGCACSPGRVCVDTICI
uniref:Uncharacterized protein n=1 Tax=Anopheles atroparvus TaxID=41427 RepID=A0AAG5DA29_ANOAO